VLLQMDTPLVPDREPRLEMPAATNSPPKGVHPFFWSGFMLVDTGVTPRREESAPALPRTSALPKVSVAPAAR